MTCVQSVWMTMKKETSSEFYLVHMVNILLADAGSVALRMLTVGRDDF